MPRSRKLLKYCTYTTAHKTGADGLGINPLTDETIQPDIASLYRRAFEEFGPSAVWSSKPVLDPTIADALAIIHSLRVEGDLNARRLAEQIERLCRATL
jgi:hypothetical protein